MVEFLARQERFFVVGSTNDVVRDWLAAGSPEVCLVVADEQTAGRGREGRTWIAPPGGALLLSLGFRPTYLAADRVWRLAATVSLAMAEAAEVVAGLPVGSIRLKWPNDLVVESAREVRKLAGVLGETDGLGGPDPRAVVGIGLNTDWAPVHFPPALAGSMTSLRELAPDRSIDHDTLLAAFLSRLEARLDGVRRGRFDVAAWSERQVTSGRAVELVAPDGAVTTVQALGVDTTTGALVVEDDAGPHGKRRVVVGEIRHVRVPATGIAASAATPTAAGV